MTRPPKPKKPKVYRWICQYCNLEFETTVYSQRYCSKTHKKYELTREGIGLFQSLAARPLHLWDIPPKKLQKLGI